MTRKDDLWIQVTA